MSELGKTGKSSPKSNGKNITIEQKSVYRGPNTIRTETMVRKIGEAPKDKRFILKDGRILKDMAELSNALEHMGNEVFSHHVNAHKNDFRNWISEVFGEKELSLEIEKAKTRSEMQLALLKHIVKEMF